jgi:hypothetical protein
VSGAEIMSVHRDEIEEAVQELPMVIHTSPFKQVDEDIANE